MIVDHDLQSGKTAMEILRSSAGTSGVLPITFAADGTTSVQPGLQPLEFIIAK